MIDEGVHPMTMYFPLVVHGGFLIEPTESESRDGLDTFIATMRRLAAAGQGGRRRVLHRRAAPRPAPAARRDARRPPSGAALAPARSNLRSG